MSRAEESGMVLTEEDAAVVKGMLLRMIASMTLRLGLE